MAMVGSRQLPLPLGLRPRVCDAAPPPRPQAAPLVGEEPAVDGLRPLCHRPGRARRGRLQPLCRVLRRLRRILCGHAGGAQRPAPGGGGRGGGPGLARGAGVGQAAPLRCAGEHWAVRHRPLPHALAAASDRPGAAHHQPLVRLRPTADGHDEHLHMDPLHHLHLLLRAGNHAHEASGARPRREDSGRGAEEEGSVHVCRHPHVALHALSAHHGRRLELGSRPRG
mmetsp:Transcript_92425/g.245475  ORF Transcript_92425/g.245475 Transcript_92425/m.245475 type:complete len:225 (+) Transcript_92425:28-702(+)